MTHKYLKMTPKISVFVLLGIIAIIIYSLCYSESTQVIISKLQRRSSSSLSSACLLWNHDPNYQAIRDSLCVLPTTIQTIVWTHRGTGFSKYLQWIVTRRIANIRVTRLDDECYFKRTDYFSSSSTNNTFVQINLLPSLFQTVKKLNCLDVLQRHIQSYEKLPNQLYFTRRSTRATTVFDRLDHVGSFDEMNSTDIQLPIDHPLNDLITMVSEDLLANTLVQTQKKLHYLLQQLGIHCLTGWCRSIIAQDASYFLAETTWWDRSDVGEHLFAGTVGSDDFYRLHGKQTIREYIATNRRCARHGILPQLQSETTMNRTLSERCKSRRFDCRFSDLFTFDDRESMYHVPDDVDGFQTNPIKCGFTIPSAFDRARDRYKTNERCRTIVLTVITNCYDPLPGLASEANDSYCFVALTDARTFKAMQNMSHNSLWDIIDLGKNATPFTAAAKSAETLKIVGTRLFPLARWIIWLDGKARMKNIPEMLKKATSPFTGARHPISSRTSESEVQPTIGRLKRRERTFSARLNASIKEVLLQYQTYQDEGFYNRSASQGLKMYDIAVFFYRNHHPCIQRYICGWHNEVNYFSYRGQLSVLYPAERLNLTNYFDFLTKQFYATYGHHAIC